MCSDIIKYTLYWYPLPPFLPYDVISVIIEFAFDPLNDPWV